MSIVINILILLILFFALGFGADLVVKNIKFIALTLRMKLFVLGIVLGLVTTLPELSVGINATLEDVASLSVGNIMGGVIVIIGLVLGTSLILNRKVSTRHNLKAMIPASIVILSPFLLGVDGKFGTFDGLVIIALYIALIFYLYKSNHSFVGERLAFLEKKKIARAVCLALVGVIIVILSSHWIISLTLIFLERVAVDKMLIGLLLFSVGTNLPEIMITITSWRRKAADLSLSLLISSAFTNILILGILSVLKPITFVIGPVYYVLGFFVALMVILLIIFSRTDKSLNRMEGLFLLLVYIFFVITNIVLASL